MVCWGCQDRRLTHEDYVRLFQEFAHESLEHVIGASTERLIKEVGHPTRIVNDDYIFESQHLIPEWIGNKMVWSIETFVTTFVIKNGKVVATEIQQKLKGNEP